MAHSDAMPGDRCEAKRPSKSCEMISGAGFLPLLGFPLLRDSRPLAARRTVCRSPGLNGALPPVVHTYAAARMQGRCPFAIAEVHGYGAPAPES
jgi:hypothetical protein